MAGCGAINRALYWIIFGRSSKTWKRSKYYSFAPFISYISGRNDVVFTNWEEGARSMSAPLFLGRGGLGGLGAG